MFVYLVKCSCEKNTHLLHPVRGPEGPAAIMSDKMFLIIKKEMHVDVCARFSCWIKFKLDILIYRK